MSEHDTPRVSACIEAVMLRYPSDKSTVYFTAVHQELAPLARELERENAELRAVLAAGQNASSAAVARMDASFVPLVGHAPSAPVDVCAQMRALCSACGGTGDVTSVVGEWLGSCDCQASAPVAPDERAAFEAEISKLADRVDFERYTDQKAARNNHNFPAPQFKPVEIGDYVLSSVQSGWRMWQARTALSVQAEPAAIPEGWKLVPENPTGDMFRAAAKVDNDAFAGGSSHGADDEQIWHAMYFAAPTPPTTGEA